ncbi:hypothetical protein [Motilimonas pumila]|uniref:Uncharacterized protein n=1 Tax=Motilimonas pumila TaxID=2303987 RepID=A0A418YEL3_9GAMM|nr:hypothetical protein [Motilimonas pumila]RJG47590.1 hypothetical protein D1Z90_10670 [Motilimonas pumila]
MKKIINAVLITLLMLTAVPATAAKYNHSGIKKVIRHNGFSCKDVKKVNSIQQSKWLNVVCRQFNDNMARFKVNVKTEKAYKL